jgi:hypothetical protein
MTNVFRASLVVRSNPRDELRKIALTGGEQ